MVYITDMLTRAQVRAARALLGWRQIDLSVHSGVPEISIKNLEVGRTDPRVSTLSKVEAALERAGIEFMEGGARLRT